MLSLDSSRIEKQPIRCRSCVSMNVFPPPDYGIDFFSIDVLKTTIRFQINRFSKQKVHIPKYFERTTRLLESSSIPSKTVFMVVMGVLRVSWVLRNINLLFGKTIYL